MEIDKCNEKISDISNNVTKLYSYLHVLQGYCEIEYATCKEIANIKEIIDLSVKEINSIIKIL